MSRGREGGVDWQLRSVNSSGQAKPGWARTLSGLSYMVISPVRMIPHTHDTVPSRARAFRTETRNAYRMQNVGGGVGEIIRCLPQNLLQNIAYAPRIRLPLCALRVCVCACVCYGALLPQCVTRAANESWWKSLLRSFLFSFCGTFLWFALFHIIALCAFVIELVREFPMEYFNMFFKIFSNAMPNSKTLSLNIFP